MPEQLEQKRKNKKATTHLYGRFQIQPRQCRYAGILNQTVQGGHS